MSKPSIILIPGSFGLPEFYDPIVNAIKSKGYEIIALHLPSVGPNAGLPRDGPPPSMYDDAACIATETEKLVNQGKDVVLWAHSYGGIPMTQSTKGLGKEERKATGKSGGIVRLAYMTCLVPEIGMNAAGVLSDVPKDQQLDLKISENGWMRHDPISASAAIVFSDLPQDQGEAWISKFPQHSAMSFTNELTHAGYKDIPSSYLLCEDDLCIPAKNQRDGIELIEKVSGKTVDVTSIKAGHCPNETQMQMTLDWILDVVSKV